MKQLFSLFITFMICALSFCDEPKESKTRYYRHEVNVAWGIMFVRGWQWREHYNEIVDDLRIGSIEHSCLSFRASRGIHLGYYYHLNKHLAVGMLAAFMALAFVLTKRSKDIKL